MLSTFMISLLVALLIVLAFIMVFLHEVLFDYATSNADYSHWERPLFYGILMVIAGYFAQYLSLRIDVADVGGLEFNLTGIIIPVAISLILLLRYRKRSSAMLLSTIFVAIVGFFSTTVIGGTVVSIFPFWLMPVTAAVVCGLVLVRDGKEGEKASVAYFSGSIGMLIGGDLFRLPLLLLPGSVFTLGAGGIMDFVFLVGPFSVAALWLVSRVINMVAPWLKFVGKDRTQSLR